MGVLLKAPLDHQLALDTFIGEDLPIDKFVEIVPNNKLVEGEDSDDPGKLIEIETENAVVHENGILTF